MWYLQSIQENVQSNSNKSIDNKYYVPHQDGILNLVPIFSSNAETMPPSVLLTEKFFRKTPTVRSFVPDESETFKKTD